MINGKVLCQVTLVLTMLAVVAMSAYAQPGGGRGGRGGFGGPGGPGGFGGPGGIGGRGGMGALLGGQSMAQFVSRTDVQKELDLDSDQIEELGDLARNAPNMFRIMQDEGIDFRAMRDMDEDERREKMEGVQKKVAATMKEADKEALDVLTSKQKSRAKELKFQYDLGQGRAVAALASIDIEVKDREEVQEAINEVNQKLAGMRLQMYAEALSKMLGEDSIEDMTKEVFEFDARAGGRGGRGGPQAGGRGGRPGRGGGDDGGANPRRRRGGDDEDSNPRRRRPE